MDLDDADFDRKLRADVARIEAFEKRDHEIKLTPHVDETGANQARRSIQQLDQRITTDAHRRGGVLSMLTRMFSSTGTGGAGGGSGAANFHRNILSAMGPSLNNLSPVGVKGALIGAAAPLALGALPALAAPLAAGGVGLAGVGVAAGLGMAAAKPALGLAGAQSQAQARLAAASTPAQRQAAQAQLAQINQQAAQLSPALRSVFKDITGFQKWWQGFTKSLAPAIVQPVHVITSMIKSLGPLIRQVFGGAMTLIIPFARGLGDIARMVLPLLNQAFRAAAPLMRPLLDGLGGLVAGLLPGLVALLRAAMPAVRVFSQILGTLGRDIGSMLKDFAPVLRASSVILKALLDVVSALFPIIGQLAAIFARALAPVFVQLAAVVRSLLPFLVTLGKILAGFAGAVIGDLVAVLKAVAILIKDLAPSFDVLARAAGQVFRILENSGVFGILANALLQLAPALARLVNALVLGIAPILPTIIELFAQLLTILAGGLGAALTVIANALADIVLAIPPKVLQAIVLGVLALVAAFKTAAIINVILMALSANPIILITAAVALLVIGIFELIKHWRAVWGAVKAVAEDVWRFLTHGWGQYLIPQLFLIRKAVEFVRDHWKQAWDDIKGAAKFAWHIIYDDVISKLISVFTHDVPHAFRTGVDAVKTAWKVLGDVVKMPVKWVIGNVINGGLIKAFDWVSDKVHGPHINPVRTSFARGGRIPGYGGGDILPALLEPGETIVSKDDSRHPLMQAAFTAAGVPGFQAGGGVPQPPGTRARFGPLPVGSTAATGIGHFFGSFFNKAKDVGKAVAAIGTGNARALSNALADMIPGGVGGAGASLAQLLTSLPAQLLREAVHELLKYGGGSGVAGMRNPLRAIRGLVPERIDMGVDYAGTGPIYAIGPGVITHTDPSGWPGTAFINERLTGTPYAGKYIYFSEGIIPRVRVGQRVGVNDVIGQMTGGIEAGWASGVGAGTMAAQAGQAAGGSDPGANLSAYGANFNQLMIALGVPSGTGGGRSVGRLAKGFYSPATAGGGGRAGSYSVAGMAQLWRNVGGAANLAHLMGAIGMAESGGNPRIVNSIGASGLWQILMPANAGYVRGNVLNPMVNAAAAHRIYLAQGLRAWEAYTNGSYRKFMDSGGWLEPGGMNGTGRPEAVLNPGQSEAFVALAEAARKGSQPAFGGSTLEAKIDRLIRAVERGAAVTGGAVADALNGVTRQASYRSVYGTGGV